uniref:Uncharacterized protein n=1 Tax=Brassica oleracea TaxID=3712 RepID=A0A3P6BNH1_BRAOL|nr:unnamed protein product [Brassica oleracea]
MNDNEQAIVELTVLQPEHPSSLVLSPQVFEEEPLDYPHQRQRLDTRKPLDDDPDPIFDEEDESGPVFDEEATSITSIVMESHLCFDLGTTHAILPSELQEHCKQSNLLNSQPDMFVKISSLDPDKTWHFLRSICGNCVDMHVLKMTNIVACLDKILVCNVYFDEHLERLKCVLLVLGKEILIFELNKYLSATYDPCLLVSVLSV